jgi:hypothetical protein
MLAFIIFIALSLKPTHAGLQPTCRQLIANMIETIGHVKTASYTLNAAERVNGKISRA